MKHAYIIFAHNEPEILRTLLRMLKDDRNDIFLHVDARSRLLDEVIAEIKKDGSAILLPRVKAHWGAVSLVKMELEAMETVRAHGSYVRYHLISGVDLPLQTQDYIHEYCDVKNRDREFVGIFPAAEDFKIPLFTEYRRFFMEQYADSRPLIRKFFTVLRQVAYNIQKVLKLKRHFPVEIKRGDNWVSLTETAVDYLVARKKEILRTLRHVYCPDEMLVLTYLWNSPLRPRLFDESGRPNGCMREIDWQSVGNGSAHPHEWTIADLPRLKASDKFFARKFTSKDFDVVREVEKHVCGKQTDIERGGR